MRNFARFSLFLFSTLLVLWFIRAPLYRSIVSYHVVGPRPAVGSLAPTINAPTDFEEAIDAVLDTTAARLHFSTGQVSNDPRKLVPGSPANCIGYAALFSALLKGSLQQSGLAGRYDVAPVIAKLYIGGFDLHSTLKSEFWKDHDIVRITNKNTGEQIFVDPTLYDVTSIGRVRMR